MSPISRGFRGIRPQVDIGGALDQPVSWTREELLALPAETPTVDIHCVTAWSKPDTTWKGVSLDTLLEGHMELMAEGRTNRAISEHDHRRVLAVLTYLRGQRANYEDDLLRPDRPLDASLPARP